MSGRPLTYLLASSFKHQSNSHKHVVTKLDRKHKTKKQSQAHRLHSAVEDWLMCFASKPRKGKRQAYHERGTRKGEATDVSGDVVHE